MDTNQTQVSITVENLFVENEKALKLEILTDKESFSRQIEEKELHRPGLALTGFVHTFNFSRVQVFGDTEIDYLNHLSKNDLKSSLEKIFSFDLPCVIISKTDKYPQEIIQVASQAGISVFKTPYETTKVFQVLGYYLDEKFAPIKLIHGTLVDIYGVGALITGRSGIGKSEVALDLVARGHRLVVDDAVTIKRRTGGILVGTGNESLEHHMEIRGLGIIDIRSIYGIRGVRRQKCVEIQLELIEWDCSEQYERLGLEEVTTEILGEQIPLIRLPIYPGKNISVIAEVIALDHLLRIYGHHSAKKFEDKISHRMYEKLQLIDGCYKQR